MKDQPHVGMKLNSSEFLKTWEYLWFLPKFLARLAKMSGVEIVGVVLGAIPLLISTLEHYRHGASAIRVWRRYDREIKSLVTDLENERIRLQDVSEKLLTGIIPDSKVDYMINDPFGPSWREDAVRKMIEARLWNLRPYQILLEKVGEIKVAIEDIARSIDLPLNGEVSASLATQGDIRAHPGSAPTIERRTFGYSTEAHYVRCRKVHVHGINDDHKEQHHRH